MSQKKDKKPCLFAILFSVIIFIGLLCLFSAIWYINVYGNVGFDAILYTLFSKVGGAETSLIYKYIFCAAVPALLVTAVLAVFIFYSGKRKIFIGTISDRKLRIFPLPKAAAGILSFVLAGLFIFYAAVQVDLVDYIKYVTADSSPFIKENYVSPDSVSIKFPSKKQNLIIIYLESMETSFLSSDYEGGNDVNPIPELVKLAEENINFSQNGTVGGFYSPVGTDWTAAALVATTAGIPLKTPFGAGTDEYGKEEFLPGVTTLSDILGKNGYYQAFMCGSEATFGGRAAFYKNHKTDDIFDLNSAKAEGIVPNDYNVWWGMEDLHLFEYAKKKLTEISKGDKPFALSMLTVDTHHVGGYVCSKCESEYPEQYENVLACSSRQVYEFVNWIKEQDFYENTTIVLTGDHPTMDGDFVANNIAADYERRVYNCFINSKATTENTKNRLFSSLDMFPTILASIGCEIKGDKLGLGTNVFSSEATLYEKLGKVALRSGLAAKSDYYDYEFLKKTK